MTVPREPRTPEEALAAALYYHDPLLTIDPRRTDSMTRARELLAALEAQGWRLVSESRPDTGERRLRRLPRFGVVDGVIAPHHKGTMIRLDDALAALGADSEPPGDGGSWYPDRKRPPVEPTSSAPEAADWRNAAIEAGGTGEIRPGRGGVAE